MTTSNKQGLIAILTANTVFGLNIPVTKALVSHWMTPMGYTVVRMFCGAVIFWLIGSFLKKDKVQPIDLIQILIGGLIGFLGTQFLFSKSLEYTSPVIFSLVMALTPVVVLILSAIFLKEKIPLRKLIGIIISISGASLIILLSNTSSSLADGNTIGILLAVLCVFCYATYLIMTRRVSIKYEAVTIAKWMFLISIILSLPFNLNEVQNQRLFTEAFSLEGFSLLAFAIIFSTTLAFFLMPYALKRLEASTVSVFMNVQPIVASIVAIGVGQDTFSWDKPIATLLVALGVYLVTTQKQKKILTNPTLSHQVK